MNKQNLLHHLTVARLFVLGLLAIAVTGCASSKEVDAWTPTPIAQWRHITVGVAPEVENGYRITIDDPIEGLFPASLGVTRVGLIAEEEDSRIVRPRLVTDPRNEFLQWNASLDDQMAVSEVFPIAERDLGGGEAEPEQILAAFRALHATLSMVYAVNELSEDRTEIIAVLHENSTGRRIAAMHAMATSIPLPEDYDEKDPVDLWKYDSRALARAELEKHLRACMRELIARNVPTKVDVPAGWKPEGPLRPVEWPPRFYRDGR